MVRSKLHWDPHAGQTFSVATNGDDFERLLKDKLLEEYKELGVAVASSNPDRIHQEIIDLMEVLITMGMHFCSVHEGTLLEGVRYRRAHAGDFEAGVVLETS